MIRLGIFPDSVQLSGVKSRNVDYRTAVSCSITQSADRYPGITAAVAQKIFIKTLCLSPRLPPEQRPDFPVPGTVRTVYFSSRFPCPEDRVLSQSVPFRLKEPRNAAYNIFVRIFIIMICIVFMHHCKLSADLIQILPDTSVISAHFFAAGRPQAVLPPGSIQVPHCSRLRRHALSLS